MNHKRFTSEEDLEELDKVIRLVQYGAVSLRQGAALLGARTGKRISHEGLRKIIKNDVEAKAETLLEDES